MVYFTCFRAKDKSKFCTEEQYQDFYVTVVEHFIKNESVLEMKVQVVEAEANNFLELLNVLDRLL